MKRVVTSVAAIVLLGIGFLPAAQPQVPNPDAPSAAQYRQVIDRYCVTCHNTRQPAAELDLSENQVNVADLADHADVWEGVLQKLRAGTMPPEGLPRPELEIYDSFASYLEVALDLAAEARPNPGRPVLQRLNRSEYTNAVRDLVSLEIDASAMLPPDSASSSGFDNIGDTLTLSPLLMERYLSAAYRISRLALGDRSAPPATETYVIPQNLEQNGRVSEDLPFGSRGGAAISHYFPLDADYIARIRLRAPNRTLGREIELRLDGKRIQLFEMGVDADPANDMEIRFHSIAGMRQVGVSFVKDTAKYEGAGRPPAEPSVDWVAIEGPYNALGPGDTLSRSKILVCDPAAFEEERTCIRQILSTLARRGFRRPVSEGDIQRLLVLYDNGQDERGFEGGIGLALQGILVSPEFLFRFERDPVDAEPGTVYAISNLELASRLSFFLWSSLPDEELLDLAEAGTLKDPAVLETQVRRMLANPRAQTLVNDFARQWLHVRNLDSMSPPDPTVFPGYTENLKEALKTEVDLFFRDIIRNDRSVLDLLDADETFLNETLARHYGVPGIYGNQFRRVALDDENRWGLLGKAAILTVTSYSTRTSPTLRGKWVMDNLLGMPPPPPPPDVPALDEDRDLSRLTMRERMELHQSAPACSSCHSRMDPPGFALESFDAVGRWRTVSADQTPLDTTGVLPDGVRFEGPTGLRRVLFDRRDQFASTFTEKLLTYALGRGLEYYDRPAVRRILREAAAGDYRWSSIVMGVVRSVPFQMRRAEQP